MLTFGSVCSGIEAVSVAWLPLGYRAAWLAEIDPFPCAVLAHHYPETPNLGDFTRIDAAPGSIDVLVGGTPCQSFSVAGLRGGMDDSRGQLALEFLRLAQRTRTPWVVWENVPGVLSSSGGRDFGAFLGGLAELGYGWAYRVLDAQHFGVPQRRRRVFVVGHLGDWRRAAAVLFERQSLSGNSPPSREAGAGVARCLKVQPGSGGRLGSDGQHTLVARSLTTSGDTRCDLDTETFITHTLRADGFDASKDGTGRGTPLVPVTFNWQGGGKQTSLGYDPDSRVSSALHVGQTPAVAGAAVRRLTPRECERLMGFPDDYTVVPYRGKPAADGPRYKALGNSMAVPVVRWIGQRIIEASGDC